MSIPHQDFPENSLNFKKYQGYPEEKNERSSWAFFLSLLIYISIFYIFELSPSYVLNTTKFWFFVSVTLIFIIAADSGVFSSTRKQKDYYDEYVKNSGKYNLVTIGSHYRENVNTTIPVVKVECLREIRDEIKEIVVDNCERKFPENYSQFTFKDGSKISRKELRQAEDNYAKCGEKKCQVKCARTISDLSTPVIKMENNMVLSKTVSEKYDSEKINEVNDFSTMSIEELNRRVEEFIQRFNRQIRLQAAQNNI